jgi:hypothetical protein
MSSLETTNYVSLVGGLGNQLFQYAEARSATPKQELVLLDQFQSEGSGGLKSMDLYDFSLYNSRHGHLESRSTKFFKLSHNLILRLSNSKEKAAPLRYLGSMLQSVVIYFAQVFFLENVQIQAQPSLGKFPRKKRSLKKNSLQIGYFQHCSWVDNLDIVEELRNLSLKTETSNLLKHKKEYEELEFLAVHMRFGDYLNENSFGVPGKKYFKDSLTLHLNMRKYEVIVLFTNDEQLAKEKFSNLTDIPTAIISTDSGLTASENLELMRLAKGFIIANSTFSWWGAFLSREKNCLVTYPSPWFSGLADPPMLFPERWVGVKFDDEKQNT